MLNVALKLRDNVGFVTPKGPNFSSARRVISEIDGTEIKFLAPRHQKFRGHIEKLEPARRITDNDRMFLNWYNDQDVAKGRTDNWRIFEFFKHSWAFNGPWFTGRFASVHLIFNLTKIVNYSQSASLFHPRFMEQVVGDRLTFLYSHRFDEFNNNIQEYNAPLNWHPIDNLPVNGVQLDIEAQPFLPHFVRRHVYFPILDDVFAHLVFAPSRPFAKPKAELDKLIDEQPMFNLIEDIIDSIEVTLSPEAKEQQETALAGLQETSLVSHYPVLKWDNLSEYETLKVLSDNGVNTSE